MQFYFQIQARRLLRMIRGQGVHPLIAAGLMVGILYALWANMERAEVIPYGIAALGVYFLGLGQDREYWRFLALQFKNGQIIKIGLLRAVLILSPFLLILLLKNQIIPAALMMGLSIPMAFGQGIKASLGTIPSPFSRRPFEFTAGFRQSFWVWILSALILIIAIYVENENLGLFAIALPFLAIISYYSRPEEKEFVWIHGMSPRKFLLHKAAICFRYSFGSTVLLALIHLMAFPAQAHLAAGVFISGLLISQVAMLSKYAVFPSSFNLLQGITVTMTFFFPPLSLLIIPMLYLRSIRSLKHLLQC